MVVRKRDAGLAVKSALCPVKEFPNLSSTHSAALDEGTQLFKLMCASTVYRQMNDGSAAHLVKTDVFATGFASQLLTTNGRRYVFYVCAIVFVHAAKPPSVTSDF